MVYQRSESAQKMVDAAHTKMIVYYADGNTRTYWGRPGLLGGKRAADPVALEVLRHKNNLVKEATRVKTAIIYLKYPDQELARFTKGSWV